MDDSSNPLGPPSPFLTRQELMQRWRCSKRFVQQFRSVPYIKVGRTVLYRLDNIEAFERGQMRNAAAESGSQEAPAEPMAEAQGRAKELDEIHATVKDLRSAWCRQAASIEQVLGEVAELRAAVGVFVASAGRTGADAPAAPLESTSDGFSSNKDSPNEAPAHDRSENDAMLNAFLRFMNRLPQDEPDTR